MLFGFGGQNYDPELGTKIDQLLAGRASPQQRIEEFLEEHGVDPAKLPMSLGEAKRVLSQRLYDQDYGRAMFVGNSMGLTSVDFTPTDGQAKTVIVQPDRSEGWLELARMYAAFVKGVHGGKATTDFTKFLAVQAYDTVKVTGVPDEAPRYESLTDYPTGSILQVTNGAETEYVRIGGPFSDTDVVILATMQPMRDVSSWTVLEVLTDD